MLVEQYRCRFGSELEASPLIRFGKRSPAFHLLSFENVEEKRDLIALMRYHLLDLGDQWTPRPSSGDLKSFSTTII
ncbi:hypothetical protein DICVIV_13604 [Dictyocaulus viviparus]|uniref:Uncharacterized protein n=1 Tax=Dictyocaulus viviparus TaxID=29172 RepID=A0A0D8X9J1_DICVI|nr:hypothetical protein DICVIV_13604 [Dictyocaulus viviparus]